MSEAIDKQQIRADLVAHLTGEDEQTDRAVAAEGAAAKPTEQDSYSVDDVSQADAAGDRHAMFQRIDATQEALADAARALDVSPTDTIEAGAVVDLDGEAYVVGVASDEFTSGGRAYSGIATDAPLFAELRGKKAGDSVTWNGQTTHIDSVH